jgi:hypothetical protein
VDGEPVLAVDRVVVALRSADQLTGQGGWARRTGGREDSGGRG